MRRAYPPRLAPLGFGREYKYRVIEPVRNPVDNRQLHQLWLQKWFLDFGYWHFGVVLAHKVFQYF